MVELRLPFCPRQLQVIFLGAFLPAPGEQALLGYILLDTVVTVSAEVTQQLAGLQVIFFSMHIGEHAGS